MRLRGRVLADIFDVILGVVIGIGRVHFIDRPV